MNLDILDFDSDDERFLEGGIWYPNAANFPACKMLFHSDDVSDSDTTWTDRISSRVLTANGGGAFTKNANGVSDTGGVSALTTGVLPVIGDGYPMLTSQGVFLGTAASDTEIGDTGASDGLSLNARLTGNLYVASPAGTYSTITASGSYTPADVTCVSVYGDTDTGTGIGYRWLDDADGSIDQELTGANTGDFTATWAAFTANTRIVLPSVNTVGTHMLALMSFTALHDPAFLRAGNTWMAKAENKGKIYPGFAGLI